MNRIRTTLMSIAGRVNRGHVIEAQRLGLTKKLNYKHTELEKVRELFDYHNSCILMAPTTEVYKLMHNKTDILSDKKKHEYLKRMLYDFRCVGVNNSDLIILQVTKQIHFVQLLNLINETHGSSNNIAVLTDRIETIRKLNEKFIYDRNYYMYHNAHKMMKYVFPELN